MRHPALANLVWRMRDALTYEHWIRDDADFVRGLSLELLRSRHADPPPLALGALLLAQECTTQGDRSIEVIFQVCLSSLVLWCHVSVTSSTAATCLWLRRPVLFYAVRMLVPWTSLPAYPAGLYCARPRACSHLYPHIIHA